MLTVVLFVMCSNPVGNMGGTYDDNIKIMKTEIEELCTHVFDSIGTVAKSNGSKENFDYSISVCVIKYDTILLKDLDAAIVENFDNFENQNTDIFYTAEALQVAKKQSTLEIEKLKDNNSPETIYFMCYYTINIKAPNGKPIDMFGKLTALALFDNNIQYQFISKYLCPIMNK